MRPSKGREVICKDNTKLNLTRQCKLRKVNCSLNYYSSVGMNTEMLMLMHEINSVFTRYPFLDAPGSLLTIPGQKALPVVGMFDD